MAACWTAHEFWKDIDDELDPLQRLLYNIWLSLLSLTPALLYDIGQYFVKKLLQLVPWETWAGLPQLILNWLLWFVVVPMGLNYVEDHFKKMAHRHDANEKGKKD